MNLHASLSVAVPVSGALFQRVPDFQSSCTAYSKCNFKQIPEFLKTQKNLCDLNRKINNCEKFETENPVESWKYIKCNYQEMCFQNNVEVKDSVAACLVGATSLVVDIAKLGKLIYEGAANQIMKQEKWLKTCDQSLECKRQLASGQPTTAFLTKPENTEKLKKFNSEYLYSKKEEYNKIRLQKLKNKKMTLAQYHKEIGWKSFGQTVTENIPDISKLSLISVWNFIQQYADSEVREISCYVPAEMTRFKCQILTDVLSGVGIEKAMAKGLLKANKTVAKETAEAIDRRASQQLIQIVKSSAPKAALVKEFSQKSATSVAENEAWKKFISKPGSKQKAMTIENVKLKSLNDTVFKDEEYVSTLMNTYNDMQLRKFKLLEAELKKINPAFEFKVFSDFKSLRVAYDDIPGLKIEGKNVDQLLKETALKSNEEFADFTIKNQLVRESDKPGAWYKAAQEKTDDWVGLKAKFTRQVLSNDNALFLDLENDKKFKTWAQEEVLTGKRLKSEVLEAFKDTAVISKSKSDANVNVEVFGILRKNKDNPDAAKSAIQDLYGLESISDNNFNTLKKFYEKADVVSPGLRNTERRFATLADAPHGGMSIDMIDLGAEHIQSTSAYAFGKTDNVDDFLKVSREAEEKLTEKIFNRQREIEKKFRDITGDTNARVVCSGDGCKAYLPNRELSETEIKKFADVATAGGEQGKLRFSSIQNLASKEYSDLVVKQGEDLEKSLRRNLAGKIDSRRLQGVNFSVHIKANKPGDGSTKLHISEANGFKLSEAERQQIKTEYLKTIKESDMGYK